MEQFRHLLSVNLSKASYVFIFALSSLVSKAQVEPLLDYDWTIEKVVTDEETKQADSFPPSLSILFSEIYEHYYVSFGNCEFLIDFNDEEQTFTTTDAWCEISSMSEIAVFFYENFLMEDFLIPETFYNPFTYDFREEEDKIYLDITNNEGSVATFWTSTLSSPSFEENSFTFYPNPVNDRLHLESPQEEIQKIEIFDMNGKRVLQSNFSNQAYVEVSHLARGVYMLKVETKNGSATKKLVKE